MAKGRKKLPDEIKVLHSTDQPCRMNPDKPNYQKLERLPPAPKILNKIGRKIYRTKGKELITLNLLTILNLEMFVAYCQEISLYLECELEMSKEEGERIYTTTDAQGNKIKRIHPYHKIAKDSLEKAKGLAAEFGFTPASQSKIIAPFIKGGDPFDAFLNE